MGEDIFYKGLAAAVLLSWYKDYINNMNSLWKTRKKDEKRKLYFSILGLLSQLNGYKMLIFEDSMGYDPDYILRKANENLDPKCIRAFNKADSMF